jgi:hypothetical protein
MKNKNFKVSPKALITALRPVLEGNPAKSSVVFIGKVTKLPIGKIKATRLSTDKRYRATDIRLTIGPLSYSERKIAKKSLKVFGKHPVVLVKG